MSNDIEWPEYERRKKRIGTIGLTQSEYDEAIKRIVRDLEWEADLPIRECPNCGSHRFSFARAYICHGCQGRFEHSDLREPVAA